MNYSCALALLFTLSFTFSSEGLRLRHDRQNDEEVSFVQEVGAEDEGENMERPEESSVEEEGGKDDKEHEENGEQEVVDDEAVPGFLKQAQPHAQELVLAEGLSQYNHSTVCSRKNGPCQTGAQCCSSRCSRAHRCRPTR
jgi:hypothetical protein